MVEVRIVAFKRASTGLPTCVAAVMYSCGRCQERFPEYRAFRSELTPSPQCWVCRQRQIEWDNEWS